MQEYGVEEEMERVLARSFTYILHHKIEHK